MHLSGCFIWWAQTDLNCRPTDYESAALTNWAIGPKIEFVIIQQVQAQRILAKIFKKYKPFSYMVVHYPNNQGNLDHQTDISGLSRSLSYILRLKSTYKYWSNKI